MPPRFWYVAGTSQEKTMAEVLGYNPNKLTRTQLNEIKVTIRLREQEKSRRFDEKKREARRSGSHREPEPHDPNRHSLR